MSVANVFGLPPPLPVNETVNNLTVLGSLILPSSTGTISITFSDAFPAQVFSVDYVKIGKMVTLNLPAIQSTSDIGNSTVPIAAPPGSIPSNLLPDYVSGSTELDFSARVISGGADSATPGLIQLLSDGSIDIFADATGTGFLFSPSTTRGIYPTTCTYRSAI
jgi:hypothetical protein